MRVRATKAGWIGTYREPGDVFDVEDKAFSKTWMEKVEPPKVEKAKDPPKDQPK